MRRSACSTTTTRTRTSGTLRRQVGSLSRVTLDGLRFIPCTCTHVHVAQLKRDDGDGRGEARRGRGSPHHAHITTCLATPWPYSRSCPQPACATLSRLPPSANFCRARNVLGSIRWSHDATQICGASTTRGDYCQRLYGDEERTFHGTFMCVPATDSVGNRQRSRSGSHCRLGSDMLHT